MSHRLTTLINIKIIIFIKIVIFIMIITRIMISIAFASDVPPAGAGGPAMPQAKPLSRAETEALVKKDLASRLRVPVDDIKVADAADKTWPDDTLGCGGRKGLKEPLPVEGYTFTLAHGDTRVEYHTDRHGRFRRCDEKKPLGPIKKQGSAFGVRGSAFGVRDPRPSPETRVPSADPRPAFTDTDTESGTHRAEIDGAARAGRR
jgi:hypothetical protein